MKDFAMRTARRRLAAFVFLAALVAAPLAFAQWGGSSGGGLTATAANALYCRLVGCTMTGAVTSSVASGANAFGVGTNGARVDFGAGASDHATSNGTTVAFAGPISTTSATLTGGLFPTVTDTQNLGASTSNRWGAAFIHSVTSLNLTASDSLFAQGFNYLGAQMNSLSPNTDNTPDLGSAAKSWRSVYWDTALTGGAASSASVGTGGFRQSAALTALPTCDSTTVRLSVFYQKAAANKDSSCKCEQTGVGTYGWFATTSNGDCT